MRATIEVRSRNGLRNGPMVSANLNELDKYGEEGEVEEETVRLDFAHLAAIREAMMEELGPGRLEALPLDDGRSKKGTQKGVEVVQNRKKVKPSHAVDAENAWNGAKFDDVRQEDMMLDPMQGGQAHRLRMTESLHGSQIKHEMTRTSTKGQGSHSRNNFMKHKLQHSIKSSPYNENVRPTSQSRPANKPSKAEILERFRERKAQKQAESSRRVVPAVPGRSFPTIKHINSLLNAENSRPKTPIVRQGRGSHRARGVINESYEGALATPTSFLAQVRSPAFGYGLDAREAPKIALESISVSTRHDTLIDVSDGPSSGTEGLLIDFSADVEEESMSTPAERSFSHATDLIGLSLDEVADALVDDYAVEQTMDALQRDSTVLDELKAMLQRGEQAKTNPEEGLSPRSRRVLRGGLRSSIYATAQPLVDNFLRGMLTFGALGTDMAHAFSKDMTKKIIGKLEYHGDRASDAPLLNKIRQDRDGNTYGRRLASRKYTIRELLALRQTAVPVSMPNMSSWMDPIPHATTVLHRMGGLSSSRYAPGNLSP